MVGSTKALNQIQNVFERLFLAAYRVQLLGGAEEPVYLPPENHRKPGRVVFTRDYVSSALHEVAHWCIAGEARRKLVDYGYWYHADGRPQDKQCEFERVEVKPQALEWIFSTAIGHRFRVSLDNLHGAPNNEALFKRRIAQQARRYIEQGLPRRAEQFLHGLVDCFREDKQLPVAEQFRVERLA